MQVNKVFFFKCQSVFQSIVSIQNIKKLRRKLFGPIMILLIRLPFRVWVERRREVSSDAKLIII